MSVNARLAAQALAPPERPAARRPDAVAATAAPDPGLGFEDLIDAVNPLQHLPVVSAVYREASGDGISLPSRLAGAFLFGGPTGLAGAVALTVFEEITGDTILGHLSGLFGGGTEEGGPEGRVARPPGDAPAGSRGSATLPWLAAVETAGAPALPSSAALAEALDRLKAKIPAPAPATDAAGLTGPTGMGMAAAGGADGARPAPQTLARLYELQAMQPNRKASAR